MSFAFIVLLAGIGLTDIRGAVPAQYSYDDNVDLDNYKSCALSSLYVGLKILDVEVEYRQLAECIGRAEGDVHTHSFQQIADAASEFGVESLGDASHGVRLDLRFSSLVSL